MRFLQSCLFLLSLIVELTDLYNYKSHKRILTENEQCKFLIVDKDHISRCYHLLNAIMFRDGICTI